MLLIQPYNHKKHKSEINSFNLRVIKKPPPVSVGAFPLSKDKFGIHTRRGNFKYGSERCTTGYIILD